MGSTLPLICFGRPPLGHIIKTNYNISDCWFSLGLVSLTYFGCDFSRKYLLWYFPLTDQILLSVCFYFLQYMYCKFFSPACDVISSEISLSFHVKSFFTQTKSHNKNFNISWSKRAFLNLKGLLLKQLKITFLKVEGPTLMGLPSFCSNPKLCFYSSFGIA